MNTEPRPLVREALGITDAELTELLARLRSSADGLAGDDAERVQAQSYRLGLSVAEMQLLQRVVDAPHVAGSAVLKGLARHVLDRGSSSDQQRPGWSGETVVYVTQHGDVVHLYADCSGVRGFRSVGEADPDVYRVILGSPACAGRRACRKCYASHSATSLTLLDATITRLHGPQDPVPWTDLGQLQRVLIAPTPSVSIKPVEPPARTEPDRSRSGEERRLADLARELGLTVDEARSLDEALGSRRSRVPNLRASRE